LLFSWKDDPDMMAAMEIEAEILEKANFPKLNHAFI